jgi:hypothetical protein
MNRSRFVAPVDREGEETGFDIAVIVYSTYQGSRHWPAEHGGTKNAAIRGARISRSS